MLPPGALSPAETPTEETAPFRARRMSFVDFWASADEYWEAVGGDPPRPY